MAEPSGTVPPTTAVPVARPVHETVHGTVRERPTTIVDVNGGGGRGRTARSVSWGAIIAGSLIGVGTMIVLSLFGVALGLAVADPAEAGSNLGAVGIGSAIWFVLSQLVALFVGGYAASRLSAVLGSQKAMLHGATVWALATVALVYLATSTASSIVSTGFSALSNAGQGIASAAQAIIPEDANLPSFNAPDVALSSLPPRVQNALREQGVTADNLRAEARAAFNEVVSQRERDQAANVATNVVRDVISSPSDAIADVEAGIDRLVGRGGVFSEEDRREFVEVTQRRFGISPQDAETLVARWETRAKRAADEAQQAIATAREEAVQAAQAATEGLSTAAFWAGVASLLGLGAAVAGGAAGRRDEPVEEDYADHVDPDYRDPNVS